jgi:hypothetical protein
LVREHRGEVRRVVVVQVGQEHGADGLEAESGRDERAHRAVAAGAAACAEQHEPGAGRRRRPVCRRRLREPRCRETERGERRGAS